MGCGNSSPATTTSHSNKDGSFSNEGRAETPTKVSNDLPEDEKRLNYGGVYVGLPTDMSNIPQLQIGVLRETESDLASLMRPLWGNGS
ncbi:overexpressed in colon carcinoma 1 protein homolog isoform X2 [Platichthys flesus]|uniref:overexpressed in colon carcinoma 1 protein homolog isoform X2 n=1 Tax=Platichthys flesus TaxID=8260 RepID=UPI002DBA750C|nr:overexpressed in colon carcinoma 1 protein homolog isoform X2 [Platichthys flesus]